MRLKPWLRMFSTACLMSHRMQQIVCASLSSSIAATRTEKFHCHEAILIPCDVGCYRQCPVPRIERQRLADRRRRYPYADFHQLTTNDSTICRPLSQCDGKGW